MQKFWIVWLQSKGGGTKHGPVYPTLAAAVTVAKEIQPQHGINILILEAVAYVEPPVEPPREVIYLSPSLN